MVVCHLSPSLARLFDEFNALWPHRTHGIDGWCRDPASGISKGHNPGHNGLVHAIDVDVRGIYPPFVVENINRRNDVLYYIIWDRRIWSNTGGWHVSAYTPANAVLPYNPHTDHMHIEIYQTNFAEQWSGGWGISGAVGGAAVGGAAGIAAGVAPVSQGIGAADDRDARGSMEAVAQHMNAAGGNVGYTAVILNGIPR
jgi:hypothetical protein